MNRIRRAVIAAAVLHGPRLAAGADALPLQECNTAIENASSCMLELERDSTLTKLPVRVTARDGVRVKVVTPRGPMETVKFEEATSQVAEPDVVAAVMSRVIDPLKSLLFKEVVRPGQDTGDARLFAADPRLPPSAPRKWGDLRERLQWIDARHEEVLAQVIQWRTATKEVVASVEELGKVKWDAWSEADVQSKLAALSQRIGGSVETKPNQCGPAVELGSCAFASAQLQITEAQLERAVEQWSAVPVSQQDAAYEQVTQEIDAALTDQAYVAAQVNEAKSVQEKLRTVRKMLEEARGSLSKTAEKDIGNVGVSAKSVVKASITNRVTAEAVTLPAATIDWLRPQPWEISLGAWFSTLEKRSYSRAPVIVAGAQEAINGVAQTVVRESTSTPTVVPGVFVHYRFAEGELKGRRSAFLWSFGVGANNGAAEFALGPSWAFGNATFSVMAHAGRQLRLTDGVTVGQRNAPDISGSTDKEWVVRPSIGLSVRVPIL